MVVAAGDTTVVTYWKHNISLKLLFTGFNSKAVFIVATAYLRFQYCLTLTTLDLKSCGVIATAL